MAAHGAGHAPLRLQGETTQAHRSSRRRVSAEVGREASGSPTAAFHFARALTTGGRSTCRQNGCDPPSQTEFLRQTTVGIWPTEDLRTNRSATRDVRPALDLACGSTVNLVEAEAVPAFSEIVTLGYRQRSGRAAEIHVFEPSAGARVL
jgi:hypothetical protein